MAPEVDAELNEVGVEMLSRETSKRMAPEVVGYLWARERERYN